MKFHDLDKSDKIILKVLQSQAQVPLSEMAAKAGLSPSTCHRRIKAMEEAGLILGYSAQLNRKHLGYANEFFVEVSLAAQTEEAFEKFEKAVARVPEILECLMSGQFDYLLRVIAAMPRTNSPSHALARLPGVQRIQSSLALRTVRPAAAASGVTAARRPGRAGRGSKR
jgi:DNA-binding Lrp family transcriptional regulator